MRTGLILRPIVEADEGRKVNHPSMRFGGIFETGPLAGEVFAGSFALGARTRPSDRHIGHSLFDLRGQPGVELMVDGWRMAASAAAVFAGIGDGRGNRFDFVTISGEGACGREFEIFLGAAGNGVLDPAVLPGPAALRAMAGRMLTLFHHGEASVGELHFAHS